MNVRKRLESLREELAEFSSAFISWQAYAVAKQAPAQAPAEAAEAASQPLPPQTENPSESSETPEPPLAEQRPFMPVIIPDRQFPGFRDLGDLRPVFDWVFPDRPFFGPRPDCQEPDPVSGGLGTDVLIGRRGADVYSYEAVSDSTGLGFDRIVRFDAAEDKIDLPVEVSAVAEAVETGALSRRSFDADLEHAIGREALAAGEAVLFHPDDGNLAGRLFLLVDANGEAGYQAGEDFVIQLLVPRHETLDLTTANFI